MASLQEPSNAVIENPQDRQSKAGQIVKSLFSVLSQLSEDDAWKDVTAIYTHNDDLEREIDDLHKDLDAFDKTCKKYCGQNDLLDKEITALQDELSSLQSDKEQGVQNLNSALEENTRLTAQLDATNDEITNTINSRNRLQQQFDEKLEENKTQAKTLTKTSDKLRETQERLEALNKVYERDRAELINLRNKAVPLKDINKAEMKAAVERVRGIFESAHILAYQFFGEADLDKRVFGGDKWCQLENDKRLGGIPLVPSNSPVAKHMRVAMLLRVLAESAMEHIFQPVYVTDLGTEVSGFIEDLYCSDPQNAQWIRSVLLKVSLDGLSDNAHHRADNVVDDVIEVVERFLVPGETIQAFRAALEQWCDESIQAWRYLQTYTCLFQCVLDSDLREVVPQSWSVLPDVSASPLPTGTRTTDDGPSSSNGSGLAASTANANTNGSHSSTEASIVAKVWPIVTGTNPDGAHGVVGRGYGLDARQVKAAEDEKAQVVPLDRNLSRQRRKGRRSSLVNGPIGSFLKQ